MNHRMDSVLWEKTRGITSGMIEGGHIATPVPTYEDLIEQKRLTGHPANVHVPEDDEHDDGAIRRMGTFGTDCTGDFAYPAKAPEPAIEDESGGQVGAAEPVRCAICNKECPPDAGWNYLCPCRITTGGPYPMPKLSGVSILDSIKNERRKVYGEPRENHKGIAQMWAPMLQPWADRIAKGIPIPEHVVSLMMALLKIDRMRLVFHKDNYDDCKNYLGFSEEWQSDPSTPIPTQCQ